MKTAGLLHLFLISILVVSIPLHLSAQSLKDEVETDISEDNMPAAAVLLLNQFWKDSKKADYYREINNDTISFEAKFFWNSHRYSVEFDAQGKLLDIEQLLEYQELPEDLRDTVTKYLDSEYSKYRITRIQRQFTKNELVQNDAELIRAVKSGRYISPQIRFELEIEGQNKQELGAFELLFDKNGELLRKRRIVRRSLDNIW